jgi:hypothetical protein
MKRALLAVPCLALACAGAPVIDRSELHVSDNTLVVAHDVLPSDRFPAAASHLALAEELYGRELRALRDRREALRDRGRVLDASAFGMMAGTALAVGGLAIATTDSSAAQARLQLAGLGALAGLGIGTVIKLSGFMQEDPAAVEFKSRQLQVAHDAMLDKIRSLTTTPGPGAEQAISVAIEQFMSTALQLNIKG